MSTRTSTSPSRRHGHSRIRGARWYQRLQARVLGTENARYTAFVEQRKRLLFGSLRGETVEIGPGGGNNLRYLPDGVRWTGVEPNPFMHHRIRKTIESVGIAAQVRRGIAERLPFADASVDAVMCTLVLCSVESQEQTLREILRVLRPGGRFVFIEHVADPAEGRRARMQRLLSPVSSVLADGCHMDRRTWESIESAGFSRVELEHFTAPVPLMGPHIAGTAFR